MSIQDNANSAKKLAGRITQLGRTDDILGNLLNKAIDSSIKVPSPDNIGKNISDFAAKRKKKNENKKDVFKELLEVVESFFSNDRPTFVDPNTPFASKKMIQDLTISAMNKTLNESKQIITDSTMKVLFVGDGICGTDKTFTNLGFTSVDFGPKEFDFLNILQVNPNSSTGKIVYENPNQNGYLKMNTLMYETIEGGSQNVTTKDGTSLFDMSFDSNTQKFTFSGLGTVNKLEDFMTGYYSNIEHIDVDHVLKTATLMTLKGDGSEPLSFDISTNLLNRLLGKMCAFCGNSNKSTVENPSNQFNENDEDDVEFYFDFDDVEGIDLDDESDRLNKVLRFRDCNNFTVPINPSHFDNFVYLDKSVREKVDHTLYNASVDAHNQSDSSIPLTNFHINLLNSFILNLPKALIQSVMSPKYFLPIIIVYKAVKNGLGVVIEDSKILMKKLWRLFNQIIKSLLWRFRDHFWNLAKPHLIRFLLKLAKKILLNKKKRWLVIIASLIALLTKLLTIDISSCKNMYDAINFAIDKLLMGASLFGQFHPPGFLLSFSNLLGGKSSDIMKSGIFSKLEGSGVNTGAIFGKQTTNLQALVSSMVDGHQEHEDVFGYVASGNKLTVLPSPMGPIVIPPGLITTVGKSF